MVCLTAVLFAEQKNAALLPLESNKAYTEEGRNDVEGIYGALNTSISELGILTMVSRTNIEQLINEKEFQQKSITDKVKDAKRIANADYLIVGRLDELANTYNLSLILYDLSGTAIVTAFVDEIKKNDSKSFIENARRISNSLFSAPRPQGITKVSKTDNKVSVEWKRAEDSNAFARKLEYKLLCSTEPTYIEDAFFAEEDAEFQTDWLLNARRAELTVSNADSLYYVTVLVRNPLGVQEIYEIHSTSETMRYEIGDKGPGGGIVFYVSEEGFDVPDGKGNVQRCNYLEVYEKTINQSQWGKNKADTLNIIGMGKSNTYDIIKKNPEATKNECAAYACYNFMTPTTKVGDWFLPSRAEFDCLINSWVNSKFRDEVLWISSSQFGNVYYYKSYEDVRYNEWRYRSFETNNLYSAVLPIRAFSN